MNAWRARRGTGAALTVTEYQSWEIRRHLLETETPGKFGTFASLQAAE